MDTSWNIENEEILIDMWRDKPCLFDVSTAGFHNRNLKLKARQEIAERLNLPGNYLNTLLCNIMSGIIMLRIYISHCLILRWYAIAMTVAPHQLLHYKNKDQTD